MFVETKFFHKAGEGSGGGGGGSDPHNLGYYADLTALQTAHPTGTDGDFAILGSTDTIWVWDSGTSAWKDTDTKGQVTSVNGQTGVVALTASDVGAATAAQGAKADTAVQPGDLATVATTGAYSDLTGTPTIPAAIQVSTMPTAAVGELDKIYQFIGTTDANYTNGYFYKCVSDGQDPATYSWTQTDVQPQAGGLPDQTGNAGKFLTTDGTDASWSNKPIVNNGTRAGDIIIDGSSTAGQGNNIVIGGLSSTSGSQTMRSIAIGTMASCANQNQIAIGFMAKATSGGVSCIAIGYDAQAKASDAIAINGKATAQAAIQLGGFDKTNSDANTFKVGNYNGNFEMMSADGTIPKERLVNVVTTPSTAPVLAVADWSSNTQTITVTGVTATNTVFVAPAPASAADYAAAGILCTAQAADSLTFTCTTVPTNAITLSVVILG